MSERASGHAKFASHDPKMVTTFEVLGSYFTDTVFNHLYNNARLKAAAGKSITDEYVRQVGTYVLGVKSDKECYHAVVQGAHKYFAACLNAPAMNFGEFVDRVVGHCVPPAYFGSCTNAEKDELLGSIVCDLVANLAGVATAPDMLRRVIDERDRSPAVTIRMLQDGATTSLVTKRGEFYNSFLKKAGQARDHVSMGAVDDLKRALRKCLKEKAELAAKNAEYEIQLRDSRVREAKMRRIIELLRVERERGPAAAFAHARVPPRDTIAEVDDPLERRPAQPPPRRERIAERGDSTSESEEESESDESDESGESEEERRSKKKSGRAAKASSHGGKKAAASRPVGADFFRSAPRTEFSPPAEARPRAVPDLFAGVAASSRTAPAVPTKPVPNAMASLLAGDLDDEAPEEEAIDGDIDE